MLKTILAAMLALGAAPALAQTGGSTPPSTAPSYTDDSAWICLPGRQDACGTPLPTTALNANGYGSLGRSTVVANPPVDCFYVYPTVSRDPQLGSDLDAGPTEEIGATVVQFARFAQVCRTFAPIYRQVTLVGLRAALTGTDIVPATNVAYGDVRDAFRNFIARRSNGRPFVLIGHSQGTIHLQRLIREEIEGKPIAARMLSALLIGYNTEVPIGKTVGGTFSRTPLCTRPGQTGCVVSYVSYRAANPPPASGALFGRAARAGMTVACTHPARLAGGRDTLDSYWFTAAPAAPGGPPAITWSREGTPPTPFVRTEGLASARCVNDGAAGYLAVTVNADPADPRTDTIPGDVVIGGQLQPGWGLHLADMNLALGDLIRIVEQQAAAHTRRRRT